MNESIKRPAWPFSMCRVLCFLLPIPVAWLSLSLMSMYMNYYNMGVNSGANNGFLVLFVAPVLLTVLYITAATSLYIANRCFKSQWLGVLLGSLLIFMVAIGSFIIGVQFSLDYPTEEPQNMSLFLKYYISEILTNWGQTLGQVL